MAKPTTIHIGRTYVILDGPRKTTVIVTGQRLDTPFFTGLIAPKNKQETSFSFDQVIEELPHGKPRMSVALLKNKWHLINRCKKVLRECGLPFDELVERIGNENVTFTLEECIDIAAEYVLVTYDNPSEETSAFQSAPKAGTGQ